MASQSSSQPSSSAAFHAADIQNFLEDHKARRSAGLPVAVPFVPETAFVPSPPCTVSSHRPLISEKSSWHPTTAGSHLSSSSSSPSTEESSSIFDSGGSQRSALTATDVTDENAAPRGPYPCEFWGPIDCTRRFRVGEDNHWFEHISVHMNRIYPRKSICWFCDDAVFEARPDDDQAALRVLFRQRMDHIAQHIRTEPETRADLASKIRPDFHLLDHLLDHGLVHPLLRDKARTYREIRLPRGITTKPPLQKAETGRADVIVEKARSRGSHRNRPSHSRRFNP